MDPLNEKYSSRRSPVITTHGSVACGQPLAAEAGLRVLRAGGNAADSAVAVAAALNVTQPCSTGLGGDCFCLFYNAKNKTVQGINGSGRSPEGLSLDLLASQGYTCDNPLPSRHALNVLVPGAAAGWVDTVQRFGSGKLSLSEILQPAISIAEEGFPVAPVTAQLWAAGSPELMDPSNRHGGDLLLDGRAPQAGDVIKMPNLAKTLKTIAADGKAGFYRGRIAEAIVSCVKDHGGVLSLDDLKNHTSTFDEPIKTNYRGIDVWEMPPNGQGLTALIALNILENFDFKGVEHNSAEYLHRLIEALQLSFADTRSFIADPAKVKVPVKELLSKEYALKRWQLLAKDRCLPAYERGDPSGGSDTVYFSVTDSEGNACSFINSNYTGFGTALVPEGCGFTLHNRGANFSLDPTHCNALAPGKRSYHTIIPGMATRGDTGQLYASFGVMGAFMQPQGHVQVLMNMIDYGMDPQQALDSPRFCILPTFDQPKPTVAIETGISDNTIAKLKELGHDIQGPVSGMNRKVFGRGQIICHGHPAASERAEIVWWAGSDPRADGLAIGY